MGTAPRQIIRDIMAVSVTAVFVLPILWWGLSSITPNDVLLDPRRFLTLDFTPTFRHYALAILGAGGTIYDSRDSLVDSVIVALLSTAAVLVAALPMAHALSVFRFRGRQLAFRSLLLQRAVPPIVIVFPLVITYHRLGMLDSHIGLALAHAAINLPFAVLVLKSFFDEIPPEVREAAYLDGATPLQAFLRISLPLIKGGIAATAILAFIFSWTEFLLSLFLTQNMRLMPVQAAILIMNMWGLVAALTTTALLPAFIFILFVQRHLVRGFTLGLAK